MQSFGNCLINFFLKLSWTNTSILTETSNKNIAEVIETISSAVEEANQFEEEPEIVTDGDENRKITAVEALEVNGSDHLHIIFYELFENVE